MAVLEHQGECVASWTYFPGQGTITCPGCKSSYASTPERQFAVAFDQILTQHMQRLANDGAAILASERSG